MNYMLRCLPAVVVGLSIGGCRGTYFEAYWGYLDGGVRYSTGNGKIDVAGGIATLSLGHFSLQPGPGQDVYDVVVELVEDTNNNGVPDKDDKTTTIMSTTGKFTGISRNNFTVNVAEEVKRAWLRVKGKKSPGGNLDTLGHFRVDENGLRPLGGGLTPDVSLTMGRGGPRPHWVRLGNDPAMPGFLRVTAGDLSRADRGTRAFYTGNGEQPASDFLGLGLIINGRIPLWVPGDRGLAHVDLPVPGGTPLDIEIVTVSTAYLVVGHWGFTGLR